MKGHVLYAVIASWVCVGIINCNTAIEKQEQETELLRTLSKYSTVLRLIPIRISQMLQVVNAYPHKKFQQRSELLQLVIQRMHDKYRMVQQLYARVTELSEQANPSICAGVYARSLQLLDALKKYQITLISTLSVLDAEFIRMLRNLESHKDEQAASVKDSAYLAAKAVLKQNQMDVLIEMLACGRSVVDEAPESSSVKQEIRNLREEISQLSAQLRARALLENDAALAGKGFDAQVRSLSNHHVQAVRDAQAVVQDVTIPEYEEEKEKYSLREARLTAAVTDIAQTLHARALEFHRSLIGGLRSLGTTLTDGSWYTHLAIASGAAWNRLSGLLHRIFEDAGKAARHVTVRADEARQSLPYGIQELKNGLESASSWIINSWTDLACSTVEHTRSAACAVSASAQNAYDSVRTQVAGVDDQMRGVACSVCASGTAVWQAAQARALDLAQRGHLLAQDVYSKAHESVSSFFPSQPEKKVDKKECSYTDEGFAPEVEYGDEEELTLKDRILEKIAAYRALASHSIAQVGESVKEYSQKAVEAARRVYDSALVHAQAALCSVKQAAQRSYQLVYGSFLAVTAQETPVAAVKA